MSKNNLKLIDFLFMIIISVCEFPTYIQAREKNSHIDWLGSRSSLIHKVRSTQKWASGYSKDFG